MSQDIMDEPGTGGAVATADADRVTDRGDVLPVIEEQAFITKRERATEQVRVRSTTAEEQVLLRDTLTREAVEVRRVPVNREVAEAPPVRDEGGVTIIPVLEERLVVEKRLFLVEEIHLHRATHTEPVELPATVRRTEVAIERQDLTTSKEDTHG